jgi:predicted RNA-binding Zn-ribbon protein involved in translation (DUF1610 family)
MGASVSEVSAPSGLRLVCPACRHEIPLGETAVLIGSPSLDCPKCGQEVLSGTRRRC